MESNKEDLAVILLDHRTNTVTITPYEQAKADAYDNLEDYLHSQEHLHMHSEMEFMLINGDTLNIIADKIKRIEDGQ